jgi:hypothetical protein
MLFAATLGIVLGLPPGERPAVPPATPQAIAAAVEKALPLLAKGMAGHKENRTCFACHNQALPMLAFTTARERGFTANADDLAEHLDFIADFLEGNHANYRKGRGQGGQADTAGYALWTLEMGKWKPDETTAAVVEYLLLYQNDRDHWRTTSNRPPSEASAFTTTYLALRALRAFGTPEQQERIARRVETVRGWLRRARAKDTEDRVFRLWALHAAGVDASDVQEAAAELARTQRPDGGWAQLDDRASDAYATGSALAALHLAGGMPTADPAYQRGVAFLVKDQRPDGSWFVASRSRPFQTYFESGFPHGKDQFISMAASGWATTALALACPPAKTDRKLP